MIVTLTPNPAWDITLHAASVTPGASHRVPNGTARAGGKGINVARVLGQQRVPVVAVLPAGGATGDLVTADLRRSGMRFTAAPIAGQTRRTVAIVDDGNGQTSIFNEAGPELTAGDVQALLAHAADAAAVAGVVVGSGSLPPGCPADFYPRLVRIAHDNHVQCLIDASGPALVAAAEAGADLLKPNVEEILAATGLGDPFAAAADLIGRGAGRILLSDGARGMYDVLPGGTTLHARIGSTLSGNATGAGDAAVAAAASVLAAGDSAVDREALVKRATAWSAAAVTMPAAGELPGNLQGWEDSVLVTVHT